ncbi:2OG-Fe(II) oxygenase [Leptolyngbya ohadii]|uniref:2OG-Fe(II) oxygenase n=1 Tax=Leptolyngbya ohadii TaxID=1962290 RepID=UPI0019D4494E|nr:2OG-Fe(II) oxygenase [Leptolyngbya ohadii]
MDLQMYYLDPEYLNALAQRYRESYASADPFPHTVIDNFLPERILDSILEEFPQPGSIDWQRFEAAAEKKLASKSEQQMGAATRLLLYQLNSSTFISFLETLTGITGLIPDPHFEGGGLHQIEPGGYLKMHVDFSRNDRLKLDRRLNLLIYLNKDWKEEYGGHLELWDKDVTQLSKKILPLFNRCVIFNTTDFTFHGHPEPLTCPPGNTRKSLALYYYSNGRPAHETRGGQHSTLFRARPGETIDFEKPKRSPKELVKKLLPGLSRRS